MTKFIPLFALLAIAVRAAEESAADTNDYDLARCIETALARNLDIRKAQARVRREQGAVVEVRAAFLPQIVGTASFQHIDADRVQGFGGFAVPSLNAWSADVQLRYVLFAGGRNWAALQREQFLLGAAMTELQAVVNTVLLQTRERYFAALLAQEQIKVQEQNIKLLGEELRDAQSRFRAGTVPQFHVLRAEVALANGRAPLIRARNDLRLALEELVRVLGLPRRSGEAETLRVRGQMRFEPYEVELGEALAAARARRPELRQLEQLIAANQYGVRAARAGYAPEISSFLGYGADKSRFSTSFRDYFSGWTAGVGVNWPIFDGLATHGRIVQAQANLTAAQLDQEQGRLDVDIEVRRAHSQLMEATELVRASQEVVKQAEESVRQARARLSVGAGTQLELLDAQVALTQARTNEILALHDYNVARARLARAIGAAGDLVAPDPPPAS